MASLGVARLNSPPSGLPPRPEGRRIRAGSGSLRTSTGGVAAATGAGFGAWGGSTAASDWTPAPCTEWSPSPSMRPDRWFSPLPMAPPRGG
eukprot:5067606-Pyramimonas_sp.AAC.1